MRPEYALPEDFQRWEDHARTCTSAELFYIIRDCKQAEAAMRGWNPIKEGFYSDQASTYARERSIRQGVIKR